MNKITTKLRLHHIMDCIDSFACHQFSGTFACAIDVTLLTIMWQRTLLYLDDIATLSKSISDLFSYLHPFLGLVSAADVLLRLKKCSFSDNEIDYLGNVIKPVNLTILEKATYAIRGLEHPTNVIELKSFFSLCEVLGQFVSIPAQIAAVLYQNLMKYQPFHFEYLN